MSEKVCVLGDGSWGTAIANLIATNGFDVNIWCHNKEVAESINNQNINSIYFPEIKLNTKIKAYTDLNQSLQKADFIFAAIPVKFLRSILQQAKDSYTKNQIWCSLSKGLEQKTFFLSSEILEDVFGKDIKKIIISGPSFAHDLINKEFTAVDVALQDNSLKEKIKKIIENNYFKINFTDDIKGVQICGAFKNVIAIALGICQGFGYCDNTKAYIFTKGLNEISILQNFFGGKLETLYGLSGIGDLVLTCYGKHSKNYKLGIELAKDQNLQEIYKFKTLPEGINTIESAYQLINQNNLNLPLFKNIYNFIFKNEKFIV